MNRSLVGGWILIAAGCFALNANASMPFEAELASIQEQWAVANYQLRAGDERKQALQALCDRAHQFALANRGRAEPLIWEGIVLSTYAGAKGGLGALSLAKKSRAALEAAMEIDPNALEGSAYTSLGALYAKVPGFPLGFGDDEKAQTLLLKALTINPNGIDSNYFYAQFLCDRQKCAEAWQYLQRAAQAAPRAGRQLADDGRHKEVLALLAKAN
jgi:tetratricopeptide (TPR) repeat protein